MEGQCNGHFSNNNHNYYFVEISSAKYHFYTFLNSS